MRVVRWQGSARARLRAVLDYVSDRDEDAADRLEAQIHDRVGQLTDWPGIGRPGRIAKTRELLVHPNYFVVYRLVGEEIVILRILHARQRYP